MAEARGYLAFLLHAHLPFVRHPEHERFLEEDWFYEAITECYIPLIHVFEGLERDGVAFRLTMTLSPTVLSMMEDPLLADRCAAYIKRLIDLSEKEMARTEDEPEFSRLAEMYNRRLSRALETFTERYNGRLAAAFRGLQDRGHLEIITCAATHGLLPLLRESPAAVRAQLTVARDHYETVFGRAPVGIWLPECAYYHGLDRLLQDLNLRYFILDTHGLLLAEPSPAFGVHAPIYTEHGIAAFARDPDTSKQVWSATEGYPGDPNYRDFYRDVGFDLSFEYIQPYIHPDGIRVHTGLKYYAITGKTDQKRPYDPVVARERAAAHATHFQRCRERQVRYLSAHMDRPPVILSPYDAELFGHWWYEGPQWLNFTLRKISCDVPWIKLISPSDYLAQYSTNQICEPNPSTWGHQGYYDYWLNGKNSWIYPHLHGMARRMTEVARTIDPLETGLVRAANQMARELLLAESSDWPFIMTAGTSVDYAAKRIRSHIARFNALYQAVKTGEIDLEYLRQVELRDNLFPQIDYRVYR